MRALVQRVSDARVSVGGSVISEIGQGLLVFLGIGHADSPEAAEYLARKILRMRIFNDGDGKMNRSLLDISGELLIVSQFTLYADIAHGNRPSFSQAASPHAAEKLYDYFVRLCQAGNVPVSTGKFAADMQVSLTNDGPVTLMCYSNLDSQ